MLFWFLNPCETSPVTLTSLWPRLVVATHVPVVLVTALPYLIFAA
jgi:hypothetical protein